MTYLELLLVEEVLIALTATEEQQSSSDLLTLGSKSCTLLDETAERSNTSTGTNHDNGLRGIGRQLEVGMTDVNGNVDTIILVARTGNGVSQAVGVGRGVAILLLLQSQKIVGSDTLNHMRSTRQTNGLDNSSNADLVLLNQRRGRNGVVPRLKLV